MKRTILLFILALSVTSALFAQKQVNMPFLKKFTTGVDVFTDFVMNAPAGIDFRAINQGANVYGLYTYPIEESNFAFAIGVGLGMHNFYSNGMLNDSTNMSYFTPYPARAENGEKINYDKNKISLTYLDFPLELRYKNPEGFRFAIGARVGVKINAHTKFKGDDLIDGTNIKVKDCDLPNIESWRFGPTLQIGYKWVSVVGFYSVTKVFEKGSGPDIYPISLGISLRPF